jgi:hypothetical protein
MASTRFSAAVPGGGFIGMNLRQLWAAVRVRAFGRRCHAPTAGFETADAL